MAKLSKLTREVIEGCRDIFCGISISRVAHDHTCFAHRTITEEDTFQYPLLRLGRSGRLGFVRRYWRSHGIAVVHRDLMAQGRRSCPTLHSKRSVRVNHHQRLLKLTLFKFSPRITQLHSRRDVHVNASRQCEIHTVLVRVRPREGLRSHCLALGTG